MYSMNDKLVISKRLMKIASYLPKEASFADIGSDHAYLPVYVCLNDHGAKAIAGEVNQGPYDSAIKQVEKWNLQHRIDVRLGDGLEVIAPNEVEQITISGMGASLIASILEKGKDKLEGVNRLILQPNIHANIIRRWLYDNDYVLSDEFIMNEDGYIYEILVADKSNGSVSKPSNKELFLGPILLKNKNEAFYQKWSQVLEKKKSILLDLQKATNPNIEKMKQFEQEITWLEEELT